MTALGVLEGQLVEADDDSEAAAARMRRRGTVSVASSVGSGSASGGETAPAMVGAAPAVTTPR